MFHMPEQDRIVTGPFRSDVRFDGNNGWFMLPTEDKKIKLACCATDVHGWEHVSVTIEGEERCPTWEEMCQVKDAFWDKKDTVLQYHPSEDAYVSCHPFCLHLWRPIGAVIPEPSPLLVGGGLNIR